MSLKFELSSKHFAVCGNEYPLRMAGSFASSCRIAAMLIRSQESSQTNRNRWLKWCEENNWTPENSPDLLMDLPENLVSAYEAHMMAAEEQVRLKKQWKRLRNDDIFAQIYSGHLSAEELDDLASKVYSVVPISTFDAYDEISISGTPEEKIITEQLMILSRSLRKNSVRLRWPSPPFDERFFKLMRDELEFQLQWSLKIFEAEGELTLTQRHKLSRPSSPLTEQDVTIHIRTIKDLMLLRPQFPIGGSFTPEERKRLSQLKHLILIWEASRKNARNLMKALYQSVLSESEMALLPNGFQKDPLELLIAVTENNSLPKVNLIKRLELYLISAREKKAEEMDFKQSRAADQDEVLQEINLKSPAQATRFFLSIYVACTLMIVAVSFFGFQSEDGFMLFAGAIGALLWAMSRHIKLYLGKSPIKGFRRMLDRWMD